MAVKTNTLAAKLLDVIDSALAPSAPLTEEQRFRKLCMGVLEESGTEVADADEIKQLQGLQQQYDRLTAAIRTLLPQHAEAAHQAHLRGLSECIALGRTLDSEGWSRADFLEDYSERRRGAELQQRAVSQSAASVASPIIARFCDALSAVTSKVERQEITLHSKFAVDHTPSRLLLTLRALPPRITALVSSDPRFVQSPKRMVPFLSLN